MSFDLTSPITGAAQTGFTSPTYTLVADTPPNASNSKQWAVTALGGTQTGVAPHSVAKPFTISVFKPVRLATLPSPNPVTGVVKNIPSNNYKVITRKGASPYEGGNDLVMNITTVISIPAGVDTYEPEEIRAMLSAHIGALNQQSAGMGDTTVTGILG